MATNNPFSSPELQTFHGGFIPTPFDPRQRMFQPRATPARLAAARKNHDLRARYGRSMCMPVGYQKQVGSCAAWTWGYEIRGMLAARYHILQSEESNLNDTLAPRFIYDVGRGPEFMNTYPQDSGMDMRSGAAVLLQYGVCPEHDLPYQNSANNGALASEITEHVKQAAAFYGISGYYQCQGQGATLVDNILLALDEDYPVALAILVPESFEQCPGNGRIPTPGRGEAVLGGHAITCVGNFIDNSYPGGGCLIIQNHWDVTWGAVNDPDTAGFAYLPFSYFTTSAGQYGYWGQEGWVAA
jgi:C1A family cysteine protease